MGKVGNVFVLPNITDYSELRSDKDAKARKDAFNKLAGYIADELDFKSDTGCSILFDLYKQALTPIAENLSPLTAKYGEIIGFLQTEDAFGYLDNAKEIIENAGLAINNAIDKINGMCGDINGWCSDIKNLLVPNIVESISEYRSSIDLYESLYEQLKITSQGAKALLITISNIQSIQTNLYVNVEQSSEINANIDNANKAVNEFFGLIGDACMPEKADEKAKPKAKKESSFVDKFKDLTKKFEELKKSLEDCTEKYRDVCRERRQEDIEKLKALHARVNPNVPSWEDKVYILKADGRLPKEKSEIEYDKVATLALSDIVQAYGNCPDETFTNLLKQKTALLSPVALIKLNLITEDTEGIMIVDSGYPVEKKNVGIIKLREAYKNKCLVDENKIVYITKGAVERIFS